MDIVDFILQYEQGDFVINDKKPCYKLLILPKHWQNIKANIQGY